jgi:hypothetical protein
MRGLVFAVVLFVSCGTRNPQIDGTFVPFVTDFEKCQGKVISTTIVFGATRADTVLGVCSTMNYGMYTERKITISPIGWARLGLIQKKALIFHELLHCEQGYNDVYNPVDVGDWMYYQNLPEAETVLRWGPNYRRYCVN